MMKLLQMNSSDVRLTRVYCLSKDLKFKLQMLISSKKRKKRKKKRENLYV